MTGGYFDFNTIASFILSDKSYINKRYVNSEKHIPLRLELIAFMLDTSEAHSSKKQFPMKELLEYVFGKFSHGNKEIRKQTQKIIVQMYQKLGWYALESYIAREVPQNQLQSLIEDIPEAESLIKKKDQNKDSQSLREALKAVKEASQSVQKVDDNIKKQKEDSKTAKPKPNAKDSKKPEEKKNGKKQDDKKPAEKKPVDTKKANEKKTDEKGKNDAKKTNDKKKK